MPSGRPIKGKNGYQGIIRLYIRGDMAESFVYASRQERSRKIASWMQRNSMAFKRGELSMGIEPYLMRSEGYTSKQQLNNLTSAA